MDIGIDGGHFGTDLVHRILTNTSYLTSFGLIMGDTLDWFNEHSGAMGVLLGFTTLLCNAIYLYRKDKREELLAIHLERAPQPYPRGSELE